LIFFIIHIGSAFLVWLCSLIVCLRKKPCGIGAYFLLGWTLQIFLSLPAGIWQAVFGWHGISTSSPLYKRVLFTPLVSWPFNAGGYTIRWIFESTVEQMEWLVGHRSAVVMSNMPYYWFLMVLQGSILAFVFALLYKNRRKITILPLLALGVIFLVNSLSNVRWFWAGT
jgi:hypothetical protein